MFNLDDINLEDLLADAPADEPDSCRYCGCSPSHACVSEAGEPCTWVVPPTAMPGYDGVCSSRECLAAYQLDIRNLILGVDTDRLVAFFHGGG